MGGCVGKERSTIEEDKLDFKGGNVHILTSKEDWDQKVEEANKDEKIVVVNFSATWCGPCRVIASTYAEMSNTYPQFMFLTVDVDDLMDFSSTWDIRATPTFFFIQNGKQIDKLVGANKPELEKKVQALVANKPELENKVQALDGSNIPELEKKVQALAGDNS